MKVVLINNAVLKRPGNQLTYSFRKYVVKSMIASMVLIIEINAVMYFASSRPLTFTLRDVKARIMRCTTNL